MKHFSLIFLLSILCLAAKAQTAHLTYLPFYDAPKESYVKAMKTVFEDLHSRKWEKAQKDYDKVLEKSAAAKQKNPAYSNTQLQALYPLPQLSMAILYSTEGTMIPSFSTDYNKAYSLLKLAVNYPEKSKLNTFLADPDISVNISMLQDRIENELCRKATAENSEKAYDTVIDSLLPQSLRIQDMKMKREDLVFSAVSKSPTEKECERFLSKFADAQVGHRTVVSRSLDSLRYFALDGSIKSLEKYISQYPSSSYLQKAKDTLESMEYRDIKNTAASCRRFMEKYPSSKYTMDVKKRLYDYAYKEAIAEGTAEAYQRYCKEFPYELHYQNVFDSLLARTATAIYDKVLAHKEPQAESILSSTFLESVQKRDAAEKSLIEHNLVPPRRRNMWTGVGQSLEDNNFNRMEITGFDIKSKTAATVHIVLTAPADNAPSDNAENTASSENVTGTQSEIDLDFVIEGSSLKLDDIRLDGGKSSQKQSNLGC